MPTARTPSALGAHEDALSTRQRSRFAAQWFCQITERDDACALGVRPDRVLRHLLEAPLRRSPSRVCFDHLALADAAIASACVAGDVSAWALVRGHASLLERALLSLCDREHPHVAAKKFLDHVRCATDHDTDDPANLRRYSGERPLRVWLVDRLLAAHAGAFRTLRAPSPSRRLRIAFELIETKRERARAMLAAMDASPSVERLIADPT